MIPFLASPPAPDLVRLFGPAFREGGTAFLPAVPAPPLRAAWRLPVEWRAGRPLLLVRDGGVTRRFLLDTGAFASFVRPTGITRKFRVGPLRVVAGDYDPKLFDLLSDFVGVPIDGIVGTDAFAEFRLLIDPAAEEVHACPADVPLGELRASFFGHRSWRFGRATVSLPWSPTATALLDRPFPLRPLSDAVREETAMPFPSRDGEFQWAVTVAIGGRPHPLIPDWWADQTTVGPRVRVERTGRLQQTLTYRGIVEHEETGPTSLRIGPLSFGTLPLFFDARMETGALGRDALAQGKWLLGYADEEAFFAPYDPSVNVPAPEAEPAIADTLRNSTYRGIFGDGGELRLRRVPGLFQLEGPPPVRDALGWIYRLPPPAVQKR